MPYCKLHIIRRSKHQQKNGNLPLITMRLPALNSQRFVPFFEIHMAVNYEYENTLLEDIKKGSKKTRMYYFCKNYSYLPIISNRNALSRSYVYIDNHFHVVLNTHLPCDKYISLNGPTLYESY